MASFKELGGTGAVAAMLGLSPAAVSRWKKGGIPDLRCAQIEYLTGGRVEVETLRPDLRWVRVRHPAWPHASGKPCRDVVGPWLESVPSQSLNTTQRSGGGL